MQSGTTGIGTLRIYSPAKQQHDHDSDFAYDRRWVPELGGPACLALDVDERSARARSKERPFGLRRTAEARAEANAFQQRLGSRKNGLPPNDRRARPPAAAAEAATMSRQRALFEPMSEGGSQ